MIQKPMFSPQTEWLPPTDFPDLRKNLYRDRVFYKKIYNLKKTKLVDINVDSNLLIEKAKAVVTLTGSSGWQAIQKLKPAIILFFFAFQSTRYLKRSLFPIYHLCRGRNT